MVATPRPASTVVLMDESSRVYLTQRPKSMKFMGGFHVFPGGSVEEHDSVPFKHLVNTDTIESSVNLAYYIAAARELFEEVGILLGDKFDGSAVQLLEGKALKYRHMLIADEISYKDLLEQENLQLNLQTLAYIGQLITPEQRPIRFDTHFFLTKLPSGQNPIPDKTEIDNAFWITPDEALDAFRNKEIKLAPPTILTLKTIINFINGSPLKMVVTKNDLMKLLKEL